MREASSRALMADSCEAEAGPSDSWASVPDGSCPAGSGADDSRDPGGGAGGGAACGAGRRRNLVAQQACKVVEGAKDTNGYKGSKGKCREGGGRCL